MVQERRHDDLSVVGGRRDNQVVRAVDVLVDGREAVLLVFID